MRPLALLALPLLACASSKTATLTPESTTTTTSMTTATTTTATAARVGRNADIITDAEIAEMTAWFEAHTI